MTLETALISALSVVTSALAYVAKLLWQRSMDCETDRIAIRIRLEKLEGEKGEAKGELKAYRMCPADECPFREMDSQGRRD